MPDELVIYGFMALMAAVGIFFLMLSRFYAGGYKQKYPLEAQAKVVKILVSSRHSPTIYLEAFLDGKQETLIIEGVSGKPGYVPNVGDTVTVFVHADPEKRRNVLGNESTRPCVCAETSRSSALFDGIFGACFLGGAIHGAVMYTFGD